MSFQKLSFIDAVETLAERFSVSLEEESEKQASTGPSKKQLRDVLERACRFYHFILLYSEEGRAALKYLYERELGLEFLTRFQIGYAPSNGELLLSVLEEQGISIQIMDAAGLINARQKDFFLKELHSLFAMEWGMPLVFLGVNLKRRLLAGNTSTQQKLFCLKNHRCSLALATAAKG